MPERCDEDEDLIQQCIEVVLNDKAAIHVLQRRLRLGYTRAARIMEELERRGIVGPIKGPEPRDVLIPKKATAGCTLGVSVEDVFGRTAHRI